MYNRWMGTRVNVCRDMREGIKVGVLLLSSVVFCAPLAIASENDGITSIPQPQTQLQTQTKTQAVASNASDNAAVQSVFIAYGDGMMTRFDDDKAQSMLASAGHMFAQEVHDQLKAKGVNVQAYRNSDIGLNEPQFLSHVIAKNPAASGIVVSVIFENDGTNYRLFLAPKHFPLEYSSKKSVKIGKITQKEYTLQSNTFDGSELAFSALAEAYIEDIATQLGLPKS